MNWQEMQDEIMLFDGAMGTMLQGAGLKPGQCPELLNLENPEIIRKVHQSYIQAGANIIETNTFGANPLKLREYGLDGKTRDINRQGVRIAKEAAAGRALVAGSVGPTGLLLEPYGPATFAEVYKAYKEQIEALAKAGADLICIETMSDLNEIKAALLAAKECSSLPIVCMMSFNPQGSTMMGVSPETAAVVLSALGADVVGANCSAGASELLPVMERMGKVSDKMLIVQPNAGLPVFQAGQVSYAEDAASMAQHAENFVQAGVQILGGCCGTSPQHIQSLAAKVKHRPPVQRKKHKVLFISGRKMVLGMGEHNETVSIEGLNSFSANEGQQILQKGAQGLLIKLPAHLDLRELQQKFLAFQGVVDAPLALKAENPAALEAVLKIVRGRPLLFGLTATEDSLNKFLPLAAKYGAGIVAATIDESGVPENNGEKIALAEKIMARGKEVGINPWDIAIDALALPFKAKAALEEEKLAVYSTLKKLGVQGAISLSEEKFWPAWLPKDREKLKTYLGQNQIDLFLANLLS
ncbi:homocysteine S-methyltransferase family protein [Bacillota bacterium LX-D]|nr:homocysteine S-methyltransferase family protein [Bacillota bacterium LX-D]